MNKIIITSPIAKMKFVKERFVDLYPEQQIPQPPKQKSFSQNKASIHVNPESNTFQAISDLKRSQDQIDSLKRRLSYLKIHEDRNIQKVQENQRRIDVHYHAQELVRKDKLRKLRYFDSVRKSIEDTKDFINSERKNQEQKLKNARNKIYTSNFNDFETTKKNSEQYAKNLKTMKQSEQLVKKINRDSIVELQERGKISIRLNSAKKLDQIQSSRALEASRFKQKQHNKEAEMFELSRMETEMIERQSRSRMVFEESEKRLKNVRKETGRSMRSGKSTERTEGLLPDIHLKNRNTQMVII